jgi:hypothetical protein
MPNDPVSAVASWIAPPSHYVAASADPLVRLLAERKRLDDLYCRNQEAIDELEKTLPEVITCGKIPVEFPDGCYLLTSEQDLEDFIARRLRWLETFNNKRSKPLEYVHDPSRKREVDEALKAIAAICGAGATSGSLHAGSAADRIPARGRSAPVQTGFELPVPARPSGVAFGPNTGAKTNA